MVKSSPSRSEIGATIMSAAAQPLPRMEVRPGSASDGGRGDAVDQHGTAASHVDVGLDIRGLQRALEREVGPAETAIPPPPTPAPPRRVATPKGLQILKGVGWRRAGKVALGLGIVAVFGVLPIRTLLQTSSVEAVVNARVVTLRSPIEGQIVAPPGGLLEPGVLQRGVALLRVVNARADRSRLDELEGKIARVSGQREADEGRLASARAAQALLTQRAEAFRLGRIEQLKARATELESDDMAARGRSAEAAADRDRAAYLARSGIVSKVQLAHLAHLASIATESAAATRARLHATTVLLASARDGILLGDSDGDLPNSVLRGDDLRRQMADLDAEIASLDAELRQTRWQAVAEQARFSALDEVTMTVPVTGRIWEVVVSPGEQVRAGQDLVRLIDCSTAVVTADVTESVYNRLAFGSPARFIPADRGPDLAGHVVQLTGVAAAPANLAIEPSALLKEPYRVSVSIPSVDGACAVGRTGRVVFGEAEVAAR